MKVITCVQTCSGCPSQWEGKLEGGRMFYIRYRWGHISVSVSEGPTDDAMEAVRGEEILSQSVGGGMDGVMETSEMRRITSPVLDWANFPAQRDLTPEYL